MFDYENAEIVTYEDLDLALDEVFTHSDQLSKLNTMESLDMMLEMMTALFPNEEQKAHTIMMRVMALMNTVNDPRYSEYVQPIPDSNESKFSVVLIAAAARTPLSTPCSFAHDDFMVAIHEASTIYPVQETTDQRFKATLH